MAGLGRVQEGRPEKRLGRRIRRAQVGPGDHRDKHTKKADLSDDQWAHMQKVVGYIKRHSKQKPKGDVEDTNWRYSLMNWGHDPLKD